MKVFQKDDIGKNNEQKVQLNRAILKVLVWRLASIRDELKDGMLTNYNK